MSLDVNISEPDEFNCNELHKCIKTVAEINKIDNFTYHVDYLCGKGENYIANVFRVKIRDIKNQDNDVSVIVKTLVNTIRQELFHELHKREVYAYKDVINKYEDLQSNLDKEERVIFPECITSCIERGNEVIILEDLLLSGFEIDSKVNNFKKLDFDQICLVMTELGKFHALSFVYENTDPDKYAEVNEKFHDLVFRDSFIDKSKLKNYFVESYEMSLNLVGDVEARIKLEKIKPKIFDILKFFSEPKKYNVFCHGDCWINNILFKNEEDKTKMCFLDFQAMRYASPVTDIIYFLFICTDSQFRSDHLEDVKRIYYGSLESFLNLFNINVNNVYPIDEFESDMKELLPSGIIIALIELRIISTTLEDEQILGTTDLEELDTCKIPVEESLFQTRVNDAVKEAASNGVLDELCKIN